MSSNQIIANPTTIGNKAAELKRKSSSFATKISELKSIESALNSMWEGDARTEFHTQFTKDMTQLENFKKVIDDYATKLETIKRAYEDTEKQNKAIATQRTYK